MTPAQASFARIVAVLPRSERSLATMRRECSHSQPLKKTPPSYYGDNTGEPTRHAGATRAARTPRTHVRALIKVSSVPPTVTWLSPHHHWHSRYFNRILP